MLRVLLVSWRWWVGLAVPAGAWCGVKIEVAGHQFLTSLLLAPGVMNGKVDGETFEIEKRKLVED